MAARASPPRGRTHDITPAQMSGLTADGAASESGLRLKLETPPLFECVTDSAAPTLPAEATISTPHSRIRVVMENEPAQSNLPGKDVPVPDVPLSPSKPAQSESPTPAVATVDHATSNEFSNDRSETWSKQPCWHFAWLIELSRTLMKGAYDHSAAEGDPDHNPDGLMWLPFDFQRYWPKFLQIPRCFGTEADASDQQIMARLISVEESDTLQIQTSTVEHLSLHTRLMNAETKLNAAVHSDEDIEQRLERLEMQLSIEPPQHESGTYLKTDYIIELRYRKDQWGDTCNSLSKMVAIIGAVSFFVGICLFLRQMGWINPVAVPSTWPFCVWCVCCAPVCLIIHIGFEYNPTALGGVYLSSEGLESAFKGYLSMKGKTTQAGYLDVVAIYNHELRKVVRRYRNICCTIGVCSMAFMIACFAYVFHYMAEDRYPETVSGQLNEASLGNTWMVLGAVQVMLYYLFVYWTPPHFAYQSFNLFIGSTGVSVARWMTADFNSIEHQIWDSPSGDMATWFGLQLMVLVGFLHVAKERDLKLRQDWQLNGSQDRFIGRYIKQGKAPMYKTTSCEVWKAFDVQAHELDNTSKTSSNKKALVALKIMNDAHNLRKELEMRELDCRFLKLKRGESDSETSKGQTEGVTVVKELDSQHVVGVLHFHIPPEEDSEYLCDHRRRDAQRDSPAGQFVLVMEWADATLHGELRAKQFAGNDLKEVQNVARGVGEALAHMHSHGRIHGDVKPRNITKSGHKYSLIDLDAARSLISVDEVVTALQNASHNQEAEQVLRWKEALTGGADAALSWPEQEKVAHQAGALISLLVSHELHFEASLVDQLVPFHDSVVKYSEGYLPPEWMQNLKASRDPTGVPKANQPVPPAHISLDVWSFGVLLWELTTGRSLLTLALATDTIANEKDRVLLAHWSALEQSQLDLVFKHAPSVSPCARMLAQDLIWLCLLGNSRSFGKLRQHPCPSDRPQSMQDILMHPFFTHQETQYFYKQQALFNMGSSTTEMAPVSKARDSHCIPAVPHHVSSHGVDVFISHPERESLLATRLTRCLNALGISSMNRSMAPVGRDCETWKKEKIAQCNVFLHLKSWALLEESSRRCLDDLRFADEESKRKNCSKAILIVSATTEQEDAQGSEKLNHIGEASRAQRQQEFADLYVNKEIYPNSEHQTGMLTQKFGGAGLFWNDLQNLVRNGINHELQRDSRGLLHAVIGVSTESAERDFALKLCQMLKQQKFEVEVCENVAEWDELGLPNPCRKSLHWFNDRSRVAKVFIPILSKAFLKVFAQSNQWFQGNKLTLKLTELASMANLAMLPIRFEDCALDCQHPYLSSMFAGSNVYPKNRQMQDFTSDLELREHVHEIGRALHQLVASDRSLYNLKHDRIIKFKTAGPCRLDGDTLTKVQCSEPGIYRTNSDSAGFEGSMSDALSDYLVSKNSKKVLLAYAHASSGCQCDEGDRCPDRKTADELRQTCHNNVQFEHTDTAFDWFLQCQALAEPCSTQAETNAVVFVLSKDFLDSAQCGRQLAFASQMREVHGLVCVCVLAECAQELFNKEMVVFQDRSRFLKSHKAMIAREMPEHDSMLKLQEEAISYVQDGGTPDIAKLLSLLQRQNEHLQNQLVKEVVIQQVPFYLRDLLPDGVPPLRAGFKWHFFISKHELRGKYLAMTIYHALTQLGFKVWCSQFMTAQNIQVDEDGMKAGVELSEVVLLICTTGIFQQDRFWCTHVEIKPALDSGKGLIAVNGSGEHAFCFGFKDCSCEKLVESKARWNKCGRCCKCAREATPPAKCQLNCKNGQLDCPAEAVVGVSADFQPYARSILKRVEVGGWANAEFAKQACIKEIVNKYLIRDKTGAKITEALNSFDLSGRNQMNSHLELSLADQIDELDQEIKSRKEQIGIVEQEVKQMDVETPFRLEDGSEDCTRMHKASVNDSIVEFRSNNTKEYFEEHHKEFIKHCEEDNANLKTKKIEELNILKATFEGLEQDRCKANIRQQEHGANAENDEPSK